MLVKNLSIFPQFTLLIQHVSTHSLNQRLNRIDHRMRALCSAHTRIARTRLLANDSRFQKIIPALSGEDEFNEL